ncbi:MAG: hypothetical protein ACKV0T_21730 [Planctomycetales bacterium]
MITTAAIATLLIANATWMQAQTDLPPGHRAKVLLLAFSPDGRMLASGVDDQLYKEKENTLWLAESILVWDVQGLRKFQTGRRTKRCTRPGGMIGFWEFIGP